ncbi:NAD(P)H-dependent oxidoreductase [Lutibaculum baratangense]|uniref:NAD(P)H dehydrogenase (Quinone) n=1 Tax=Lutibaculum baratangense AMV1 TaxID=631454 RepID=V4QUJ4_9HYPH|nr:NAD(P)H-dependent oxidoreductase [Lutibaculum baratangense]ESR23397.1 NAD(P)H dehydrogenase (quinone) [Lutibaculum baratangense AMV1]
MIRRILVIDGHPDPDLDHLDHALADAYRAGAEAAGHEVRLIRVGELDVPLLRRASDFEHGAVPPGLQPAVDALLWCDHLVVVFPLWLGMVPAALKGLLEQMARPGVAFAYTKRGPQAGLKGRSARIVVTMGMPAILYRLWFRAHGTRALERNVLRFVGIRPVRTTMFGMVEAGGRGRKRKWKWLEKMERLGRRGR